MELLEEAKAVLTLKEEVDSISDNSTVNITAVHLKDHYRIIKALLDTLIAKEEKPKDGKLLSCPFCGGEATEWSPHSHSHYIGCKNECIPSFKGVYHENEECCREQWNTRATRPSEREEILKRLDGDEVLQKIDLQLYSIFLGHHGNTRDVDEELCKELAQAAIDTVKEVLDAR